jgi:hypothetical protein
VPALYREEEERGVALSQITVYVVRRPLHGERVVVSAWPDEYAAKFEANRWSQDYKEDWDYVEGSLYTEDDPDATA